jgi:hypothetical protein
MMLLLIAATFFGLGIGLGLSVRHRRKVWKIAGTAGALTLGLLGCMIAMGFIFATAMCGSRNFSPITSPDGRKIAQLSEDDCGAADHFHSEVRLERSKSFLGFRDNATVFTSSEDPRILELSWRGPDELLIRYPANGRYPEEFSCKAEWSDVKIACVSFPRDLAHPSQAMPPVRRGIW